MGTASEIVELGVARLARAIRAGEVSAREAAEAYLDRTAALDPKIHAFLHRDAEGARKRAGAVDAARTKKEPLGPLAGVPLGIKDVLCTRGVPTTCGSRILEGWVPPYDATVVARLLAAGANPIGKLNMDEFAMGSSTENSAFGPVRNPWDLARCPGGSSGGSAAAVAAGLCAGALGTDTGGSIRQPASFCGVVGLKPTYGRVSRYGLVAFASSLDTIGPMTREVADAAMLFAAFAGHDARDSTSVDRPADDNPAATMRGASSGIPKGLRVGVPREYLAEGIDLEVASIVRAAIAKIEKLGARVEDVSLPHTDYGVAAYYVLATAEASSNLARYDGVRYGLRAKSDAADADLEAMYAETRSRGFGPEVRRRIMLGTYVLSAGYYDAYYLRAQRVRTLIRRDFEEAFRKVDVLAAPCSPTAAFEIGERANDPLQMYLADVYTLPASLAGVPGLNVACGFTKASLPIGLQLIGPPFAEARLFEVAAAYEASTDWHRRRPPVG